MNRIVSDLRSAFASGRTRPIEWRLAQLARLADLLRERETELREALAADLGRCPLEGWFELGMVDRQVRHARRNLRRWAKPERVRNPLLTQPGRSSIVREPEGVVLILAPWNAPILLTLSPLIGALAAGNCAVVKPSEMAPRSSAALARLLPEYLDPTCVAVVEGDASASAALLDQRFDHILFTGSERVGRIVLAAAARHLTPVTLELGGKNPCVVAEDADIPTAARRIAWSKFVNAGQICLAPDHVLVDARRRAEFLPALAAAIREFYGDEPRACPDYQRVVNRLHFDRVVRFLDDGEIVVGGASDVDSLYVAPTVTINAGEDSPSMQEEIFGPVLPVVEVPDLEAAIGRIGARPRPLAIYLFTRSRAIRRRVIVGTSSGAVCVNDAFVQLTVPDLPFGGVGNSGMGSYQGRWSFEAFSHRKAVLERTSRLDVSVRYPPYDDVKWNRLRWLL